MQVFVCGAKKCKRFYHPECVAKLLAAPEDQEELENRIQDGLETFACPLHRCSSCLEGEDKRHSETRLVKCRRCPVAWHEKCLPQYVASPSSLCIALSFRAGFSIEGSDFDFCGFLSRICEEQMWEVDGKKYVMYCG